MFIIGVVFFIEYRPIVMEETDIFIAVLFLSKLDILYFAIEL